MSSESRRWAIRDIAADPEPCRVNFQAAERPEESYGEDVFNLASMKEFLPSAVYEKLLKTVRERAPLDAAIAGDVAHAMKEWAIAKGATHYTHWFQPLTGGTAEKHDAFLEPEGEGAILKFSGKNLVVGESDASSFPSGGLRSTFEARGYTAWDPTSPAFIKKNKFGATLCIPTAFCSYTGEALDKKTPLLRSIKALSEQIERLLKVFGVEDGGTPEITLGAEQEYFLVDRRLYTCRPDLIQTGRTLFGAPPPKHQQLDDHYYGAIKPRVLAFMTEVDQTLWRLGIPAKTRHNEAAPAQFEIASVFEELNLACDHNMLVMDVLRETADRHGFVCLMHEKPFDGVNGSGKHNNWSFGTNKINLLNPGKDPLRNAMFLTTIAAVIQAIDRHGELLRMATANSGNSYRLGANEAPPPIISIYLGDQLTAVIDELESGSAGPAKKGHAMQICVDTLPPLPQDATDRNRTSPFAYTGNKFEFRSPGSSQSCSGPNVILNTIVAESLDEILSELEQVPEEKFSDALQALLKRVLKAHRRIIFNGDNYCTDWVAEAERRGLPILRSVPEALKTILKPESVAMFRKYGVFTEAELRSRYEVYYEDFKTRSRIEGELALIMARTVINPAVVRHLKQIGAAAGAATVPALDAELEVAGSLYGELTKAEAALEEVLPTGDPELIRARQAELRKLVDRLEKVVDDELWPLPKYRELLFIY
ncbi:glutamine synthetase III [Victivallis vadensis]|uniref:glutamine synthetase III family protein n=1 Tax=Victivallis vadensis TaxID=172901 RepID=UPI000D7AC8DC|nr:glutamine synthetase III [Victivallis vadensis]PWM86675.1 MAG: glutamine synthetase type III [Lentisphaerota bacterium]HJH05149.1 glutamine synthetase III [Victivallis vadensis]